MSHEQRPKNCHHIDFPERIVQTPVGIAVSSFQVEVMLQDGPTLILPETENDVLGAFEFDSWLMEGMDKGHTVRRFGDGAR